MATIRTAIELEDKFSGVLNNVINAVNTGASAIERMQDIVNEPVNAAMFQDMRGYIGNAAAATQELNSALQNIEPPEMPSVPAPVKWQTDSLEVFTGSGFERFNQEVQSANEALKRLSDTQLNIAAQSEQTSVFPPALTSDMQKMQIRITAIRQRVQEIQTNPIRMGTEAANAELEQIRGQLVNIEGLQRTVNAAVDSMDIEAANQAYLRMSQAVGNTERFIRDNTAGQEHFNRTIRNGTADSNMFMNTIRNFVGAYASLKTVKKGLELSDEITQTSARLDLIVGDDGSMEELKNKIFLSAESARGDYQATADAVSKLGMQASNAFTSNDELIYFTELLNKQFVNAGTSAQGIDSVMLQLTQSMAAGKLQGEELNAVLDKAAPIVQNIQQYLKDVEGIDGNNIKKLVSEGVITAEVIKNSMFYAADDINSKFNSMPKTFSQIRTSFENKALIAFEPVLKRLSEFANSEDFQMFAGNAAYAMAGIANAALTVFDIVASVGNFVAENWSTLAPVLKVAAVAIGIVAIAWGVYKAAQTLANTSMLGCPLVWILVLVIAVVASIYAIIEAVKKATGSSVSATGILMAAFAEIGAFVWNLLLGILELAFSFIEKLLNPLISFANFIGNLFNDPIGAIIKLFSDMADGVLQVLQHIASAMDFVFGSDMADTIQGWRDGLAANTEIAMKQYGNGQYEEIMSRIDLSSEDLGLNRIAYKDASNAGYYFGKGIDDLFSGEFDPNSLMPSNEGYSQYLEGIGDGIGNIEGNTGDIKDSLEITEEDLKYLRDIAEQETVNRFTTAEITIEQTNHNTVSGKMDIDGLVDGLTDKMSEAMFIMAEGVHV